jgi:hypothetical protein
MKQLLITLTFFFVFNSLFSQSRIGYSEYEIRSEFKFDTFVSHTLEGGNKYIQKEELGIIDYYYFNSDNICTLCMREPTSTVILNWMVESYNKTYVIISPREWNIYCESGAILQCVLKNIEGTNYFVITEQ